jgi:hypothetical protein
MTHQPAIILIASVLVAACASTQAAVHPAPSVDRDVLTTEELESVRGTTQNAYSAVERLRPLFLYVRPGHTTISGGPERVHVFIDGGLAGDADVLKTIPLASVESIRRVRATTAFTQYGEIHTGDGVILVRLRR